MKWASCILLMTAAIASAARQFDLKAGDDRTLNSHKADSFVLVLGKTVIQRGPDFSQRQRAVGYSKRNHLRDLVWFSTPDGYFVINDRTVLSGIRELEKPQEKLAREQGKVGGTNLEIAKKLSQEQNRLTWERDVHVWQIYERFRHDDRLLKIPRVSGGPS